jgi:hypothetical protein
MARAAQSVRDKAKSRIHWTRDLAMLSGSPGTLAGSALVEGEIVHFTPAAFRPLRDQHR